jgi:uroporphyrinogen-III synthase
VSRSVLIVRPQPGASATAERATRLGLTPIVAPLFAIRPLEWKPPSSPRFDAVLLTSANAARHGGEGLRAYSDLPCYAVGEATAEAARAAGFRDVRVGSADVAAAAEMMAADRIGSVFHPHGLHHVAIPGPGLGRIGIAVYEAESVDALPDPARAALAAGALVLIHSPRAGALLADLIEDPTAVRIAAISPAAAQAAGSGWRECHVAASPRDEALLELAAKLCKTKAMSVTGSGR